MNRDMIRTAIERSLASHQVEGADIRVQPDGAGNWKIAVISAGFRGLSSEERAALVGIEAINPSWVDLLTVEELEWAGALPADSEPDAFPLWAEALGRTNLGVEEIVFASDLDEDLPNPAITTFYSLRGGVGRSTALVNTAKILARRGRKVIVVDMDLEAPGLANLLGVESQLKEGRGVVDLLTLLDVGGQEVNVAEYLIRVGSEDLYCFPAGRPDANYARKLSLIDPSAWYREDRNPLREFFDLLRTKLPFTPDHILIDSRTGISPISGPLLFDVPDLAVIVFFPHPQAFEGTRLLVNALATSKSSRRSRGTSLTPEPRFIASPLPAGESFDKYARRAREWAADWLQPINSSRGDRSPLLETDLTHVIPYSEHLATSDRVSNSTKDWQEYEVVADWVDRLVPTEMDSAPVISLADRKDRILSELQFPTGTAEAQSDLLTTFVETDVIRKALMPDVPLVRGRKGTGKTALFRQMSEGGSHPAIKIVAPQQLQAGMPWTWSSDAYREVEKVLNAASLNWQFFWSLFIAIRIQNDSKIEAVPPQISSLLNTMPTTELGVVELFEKFSTLQRPELLVAEWLRLLDSFAVPSTLLLFDGLDTGFGNGEQDRVRRRLATEGLFTFLIDRAIQFFNLKLKIVLREDIWRQLRFDNKSHLFGRDVSLAWRNNEDFYKVVLAHVRKSKSFMDLVARDKILSSLSSDEPDTWSSETVTRAWVLLIGERMKGSGTTYTKNWVWNRLADANSDRNPRYLLMLMNLVTAWERTENHKSRYERSIIRPRALEQQLAEVSAWALGALQEEFSELQPLFDLVKNERTPFAAELLVSIGTDLIILAQEVGLLAVYEEKDGSPERYAVPEIYRLALGMKRRGQA